MDTTKNDAARTGRRRADQMHNHVARVATRQSSNVLAVSSRRVRWSSLWINGGVRDGRAVDDVCISSSSERDRRPRRIPCRRREGHHRGDVENNTHTTRHARNRVGETGKSRAFLRVRCDDWNFNGRQTGAEDAIFSGRAANRRATGDESRGWFEQQQRAKELEWKPMGRTSGVGVIESV